MPWEVKTNGTINYPERTVTIGGSDWFELTSNDEGDVLIFWDVPWSHRRCHLADLQYDTPYSFTDVTQSDHDSFLIKTNIDTSHCTTRENAVRHFVGFPIKGCVAPDTTDDSPTDEPPTEQTTSTVASDSNQSTLLNEGDTDASNTTDLLTQNTISNSGGGGSIGYFFWLLALVRFGILIATGTLKVRCSAWQGAIALRINYLLRHHRKSYSRP